PEGLSGLLSQLLKRGQGAGQPQAQRALRGAARAAH
ncbi:MAG: hypothetical protein RJA44_2278, partial [Pseudomonadota bacterium]